MKALNLVTHSVTINELVVTIHQEVGNDGGRHIGFFNITYKSNELDSFCKCEGDIWQDGLYSIDSINAVNDAINVIVQKNQFEIHEAIVTFCELFFEKRKKIGDDILNKFAPLFKNLPLKFSQLKAYCQENEIPFDKLGILDSILLCSDQKIH